MPTVLCNRETCRYQVDQECTADQVGIVDLMCITRRKRPANTDYESLMRRDDLPVQRRREQVNSPKVTGMLK